MSYIMDYRTLVVAVCVVTIVLLNRRIKDFLYSYRLNIVSNVTYDESVILSHLQYIIQQCLDYYHLFYIVAAPKEVYNINAKIQQEIIEYLTEHVPERISPILHDQLAMIYNESNLGKVIGEIIYMTVQDFSIRFNNEMENNANRSSSLPVSQRNARFEEKINSGE